MASWCLGYYISICAPSFSCILILAQFHPVHANANANTLSSIRALIPISRSRSSIPVPRASAPSPGGIIPRIASAALVRRPVPPVCIVSWVIVAVSVPIAIAGPVVRDVRVATLRPPAKARLLVVRSIASIVRPAVPSPVLVRRHRRLWGQPAFLRPSVVAGAWWVCVVVVSSRTCTTGDTRVAAFRSRPRPRVGRPPPVRAHAHRSSGRRWRHGGFLSAELPPVEFVGVFEVG